MNTIFITLLVIEAILALIITIILMIIKNITKKKDNSEEAAIIMFVGPYAIGFLALAWSILTIISFCKFEHILLHLIASGVGIITALAVIAILILFRKKA